MVFPLYLRMWQDRPTSQPAPRGRKSSSDSTLVCSPDALRLTPPTGDEKVGEASGTGEEEGPAPAAEGPWDIRQSAWATRGCRMKLFVFALIVSRFKFCTTFKGFSRRFSCFSLFFYIQIIICRWRQCEYCGVFVVVAFFPEELFSPLSTSRSVLRWVWQSPSVHHTNSSLLPLPTPQKFKCVVDMCTAVEVGPLGCLTLQWLIRHPPRPLRR
jgi:hypothetical protein